MRDFFSVNRIMYASGFLVLCISIALNITAQVPFVGFMPVVRWIDIVINAVSACLCVFLFIKPDNKIISYLLFFIEGGVTVHMGFVGIGTLLFTAGCVFVFVNGDFKSRHKEKIVVLVLYWTLITVLLYFSFNIKMFLFEIALTLFHFGLIACLYKKLESKLSFLLPASEVRLRRFGTSKVFYSRNGEWRKNIRRPCRRTQCKHFRGQKGHGIRLPSFWGNKQRGSTDFTFAV